MRGQWATCSEAFRGTSAHRKADAYVRKMIAQGWQVRSRTGNAGVGGYKHDQVVMERWIPQQVVPAQVVAPGRSPFEQWAIDRINDLEARLATTEKALSRALLRSVAVEPTPSDPWAGQTRG